MALSSCRNDAAGSGGAKIYPWAAHDATLAQVGDLVERFDTLGDDFHAQVLGEIDQGLDDSLGMPLRRRSLRQNSVDLDDIDAELEDVRQTAVAGADVVDGDFAPQALQSGDGAPCAGQIAT